MAVPATAGVQSTRPVVASMRSPLGGESHSDHAMGPVLTLAAPLALYRYGTPTAAFGLASSRIAGGTQQLGSSIGSLLHPVAGWQLSVVQTLLSSQLGGADGLHTPAWHVSRPLHRSSSSQAAVPTAGQMTVTSWLALVSAAAWSEAVMVAGRAAVSLR